MDTSSRTHCHCLKGQKLGFFLTLTSKRKPLLDDSPQKAAAHGAAFPAAHGPLTTELLHKNWHSSGDTPGWAAGCKAEWEGNLLKSVP